MRSPDITTTIGAAALLSFVVGYLDAFTFVGCGVFANAQSGNVVLAGIAIANGHWYDTLKQIPSIAAFFVGMLAVRIIQQCAARLHIHSSSIALSFETAILSVILLLPLNLPAQWTVVIVAFAASLQFAGFTTVGGWNYTSIATTGNLRRFADAIFDMTQQRHSNDPARARSVAFGSICVTFLAGAMGGTLGTQWLGQRAIVCPVLCLGGLLYRAWRLRKCRSAVM